MSTERGRATSAEPSPPRGPARRRIHARPADVIDVFVYAVVLNLAIEYVPAVISEGFTLSLLTAVLLKLALEVVIVLKTLVIDRFHAATRWRGKVIAGGMLWVVAAGSKLVVLELVDLFFGDAVNLGGFIPVTGLVVVLLVSRTALRRLLCDTAAGLVAANRQVSTSSRDEGGALPGRARQLTRQARARHSLTSPDDYQ